MSGGVLEFTNAYSLFSHDIAARSRAVAQSISSLLTLCSASESGEEKKLLELARDAALVTTQLIAYVEQHRAEWLGYADDASREKVLTQVELLAVTVGGVRDSMLVLLKCSKEAFDNPFDYLTTQSLTASANATHQSIKDVRNAVVMLRLTIVKSLSGGDSHAVSSKSAATVGSIVQSCQRFAGRVQALVAMVHSLGPSEDPEAALAAMRHVVVALKGIIDAQEQSKLDVAEQVKQLKLATQGLLTRARGLLLDPSSRNQGAMDALQATTHVLGGYATELVLRAQAIEVAETEGGEEQEQEQEQPPVATSPRIVASPGAKQVLALFRAKVPGFSAAWEAMPLRAREAVVGDLMSAMGAASSREIKRRNRASTALQQLGSDSGGAQRAQHQLEMFMGVSDLSQWQSLTGGANEIHMGGLVGDISLGRRQPLTSLEALAAELTQAARPFVVQCNAAVLSSSATVDKAREAGEQLFVSVNAYLRLLHSRVSNETVLELVASTLNGLSTSALVSEVDNHIVADATQALAQLTFSGLLRQLYRYSNGVRTIVLYALTTLRSLPGGEQCPDNGALQLVACAKSLAEMCVPLLSIVATAKHFSTLSEQQLEEDEEAEAEEVGLWQEHFMALQNSGSMAIIPKGKKLSRTPTKSRMGSLKRKSKKVAEEVPKSGPPPHGTLNELVTALTPTTNFNSEYCQSFLTTYRSFTTPRMLWKKLMERYNVPSKVPEAEARAIRKRVPIVLQRWVASQPDDFEESLFAELYEFAARLDEDGLTDHATLLRTEVDRQNDARKNRKAIFETPPIDFTSPSGKYSPSALFLVLSSEEIARQMTIIDHEIYVAIEPSELMNQSWSKAKYRHRAANVYELINRLNTVSHWIPSMILWQDSLDERVLMVEKVIEIALHLRKLNNFGALMGMVAGLNMSSIGRLKKTWERVSQELVSAFKEVEKLMSPSGSFKAYRAALADAPLPAIPYLGTHLGDLTFVDEGNPDLVHGKINWEKREQVFAIISGLSGYREQEYSFPPVEPAHTFLVQLPALSDKELYSLSLDREPRE